MKPLNKADILKVKQSKHAYDYVQGLKDELRDANKSIVLMADLIKDMRDMIDNDYYPSAINRINEKTLLLNRAYEIFKGKG